MTSLIFDSAYSSLPDKEAEALFELDCIQRPSAEDLARLIPDLPAGEDRQLAEGMFHGLTLNRPTDWERRIATEPCYKAGWWEGWTNAIGQAWAGGRQ